MAAPRAILCFPTRRSSDLGYLGTALFTDPEHPGRYVTEDRWLTRKYFDQFRVQYADAYRDLDRECEPLTKREKDRKSTRLNSSHSSISYVVFCLKKKMKVVIMVANTYAFLQITRRRFLNDWDAFEEVISRRHIRRRLRVPLTLSYLKLLRCIA